jgi:hypothetical protein
MFQNVSLFRPLNLQYFGFQYGFLNGYNPLSPFQFIRLFNSSTLNMEPAFPSKYDLPTLRKENAIEKEAMEWNPQGQRKWVKPKRSWQRTIGKETLATGKTWGEIKQLSKNHVRWRQFVNTLCSNGS